MRELPDLGKLRRRFGGGGWGSLKLRQPGLNDRGEQRKNENRLRGRRGLLFGTVAPIFNRTAPVAITILRG